MVQAIIRISDEANHVLNIVKAKYGLRDKSEAIDAMAKEYREKLLEQPLRPAYVQHAQKIGKERPIPVGSAAALRQRYR
jgi:hypothetical protein